jgi:putative mRNA 3-end processing factor
VYATHGFQSAFSRYLREQGINAKEVKTEYGDDEEEENKDGGNIEQTNKEQMNYEGREGISNKE